MTKCLAFQLVDLVCQRRLATAENFTQNKWLSDSMALFLNSFKFLGNLCNQSPQVLDICMNRHTGFGYLVRSQIMIRIYCGTSSILDSR